MVRKAPPPCQWLFDAVQKEGYSCPPDLCQKPPEDITKLWESVSEACGITQEKLAVIAAGHSRLQVADLDSAESVALRLLPEKVARQHRVFPLHEDDEHITIATASPFDFDATKVVQFSSGRIPVFKIAPPAKLDEAISVHYSPDRVVEGLVDVMGETEIDDVVIVARSKDETISEVEAEKAPVVKLTSAILRDAIARGASDIHIEPSDSGGHVRFRIDGVMRHYMQMPMPALVRAVSRFKVISRMDIADRIRPQDGRVTIRVRNRTYDLRVSTVPTRVAEKMVIRVLDPTVSLMLDDIGVPPRELEELRILLSRRDSIVIITGPTGSGKTTTFYAALRELSTGEVNIITVEDPIEYQLSEVTQIQVEQEQGVTFASALRAILRQDPDIIMIGEIRDRETAGIAAQASQTGHLVLATLHTNDSLGVISRLEDLGLSRTIIAESVRGALAQRLMRKVCRECAEPVTQDDLTEEERALVERFGEYPRFRAKGCSFCGHSGYRGRFAIMELWSSDTELETLIADGANIPALRKTLQRKGMKTLYDAAVEKLRDGTTTLDEMERVLGLAVEDIDERGVTAPEPSDAEGVPVVTVPVPEADGGTDRSVTAIPLALVVDDDKVNRRLARSLLEKNGFQVVEADDGLAAVELLKLESGFSLMVLDLEMPAMGGEEVLKEVRSSIRTAGLPVVILTGVDDYDVEVRLMEGGADDYIRKPLNPPKFMARVNAVLRRAGT